MTKYSSHKYYNSIETPAALADTDELGTDFSELKKVVGEYHTG